MSLFDKINLPQIYKVHSFTSGTSTFAVTGSGDVEYLIIAGAGGGGGSNETVAGSGGGAGGFRTGTGSSVTAQSYTVTVGTGGSGGIGNASGSAGNDSVFNSITSSGGGGGSAFGTPSTNGGSGGGKGWYQSSNGSGNTPSTTPSQGNDGGLWASSDANYQAGAGGGGSGAVGGGITTNTQNGANGGIGTVSSIAGSNIYYAGGGAGGSGGGTGVVATGGTGGSGGGGNGGNTNTTGTNGGAGTNGLGSGGGGGGAKYPYTAGQTTGGSGGSGIVIIRYLNSSGITATGGTISYAGVANQRVVENFSGSALDTDRWILEQAIGASGNTGAMVDSVDGGYAITPAGVLDAGAITFNDKRQYSYNSSVCIAVCNKIDVGGRYRVGLSADKTLATTFNDTAHCFDGASGNIYLQTANGTAGNDTASDVTANTTNVHGIKIETKSSSVELSIDGVFKVVNTTYLPLTKLQPVFLARGGGGSGNQKSAIRYMEAYNT